LRYEVEPSSQLQQNAAEAFSCYGRKTHWQDDDLIEERYRVEDYGALQPGGWVGDKIRRRGRGL